MKNCLKCPDLALLLKTRSLYKGVESITSQAACKQHLKWSISTQSDKNMRATHAVFNFLVGTFKKVKRRR